jgi:predicted lipid-binding transport protein (Tim44 family)
MEKLQSPEYAKQNIINNYKANYTGDHQSSSDVELFLNNALDQYEKIVRADCAYDRDKQDEAVKNLYRDYLKNLINQREDEIKFIIGDNKILASETIWLQALKWVKTII